MRCLNWISRSLKPGAKLTVSLKQLSGRSHLIGRFTLSATDESGSTRFSDASAGSGSAHPFLLTSAARLNASRSRLMRSLIANEKRRSCPRPLVYAAGKKAEVLLAVSKGTPTTILKPKVVQLLKRGEFEKPMARCPAVSERGHVAAFAIHISPRGR
jgi:hypothetical protein